MVEHLAPVIVMIVLVEDGGDCLYFNEANDINESVFRKLFGRISVKKHVKHVKEQKHFMEQKQVQIHEQKQVKVVYAPNIEVYYWAPSIKNLQVGHLALRIIDDEQDIYISHWPKGQKVSFSFDMEDEGRSPDEYLLIPENMIYVDSVKQWWTQFLKDARKGTEKYNLIVNNCAQIVYRALRAGSFPHYVLWFTPKFTPYGVKEWVKGYRGVTFKKDYSPASYKQTSSSKFKK